ncbi:YafY family protein [Saccharibacillus sp. JS10]|uniref:helix-turn-helix transcriptional regulator n=1 Tax=Saccharibacillus sp. JS10 TaxID=2950552 RepID=UPI00210E5EA1|nr:YafY family protein [Saccharibacillus sp. JS10]MCQ4087826.1 YafY family transcriptional regulator [Saccharibacillus sp. JS10]
MDKVERLISIIMVLLRKQIVSSNEFAQLYGVTKRTILRDMETLSLANIPIYAVNGTNGGYGIMDTYKMDKRLLTSADLEHILSALGGLEKILLSEEVALTIRKIEAMISTSMPAHSIELSFYDWDGRSQLRDVLKICQTAITERKILTFGYIDRTGQTTSRTIEPIQIHFNESSWYVKGFCLERMDTRLFKLSRIDHLQMTSQTFLPREPSSDLPPDREYRPELVTVQALISPIIQDRMIERYGRTSIAPYSDQELLATLLVPQNEIGFQFLASFGTSLKVIEPSDYLAEFRAYLQQMNDLYAKKESSLD